MIGDLFARGHADIATTLEPEAAQFALQAASERASPAHRACPERLQLTGTFVWRGEARPFSMTAEIMTGRVRLDGAMAAYIAPRDEDDYGRFVLAVKHGADYLIEDVRDRLARLERILAEVADGRVAYWR